MSGDQFVEDDQGWTVPALRGVGVTGVLARTGHTELHVGSNQIELGGIFVLSADGSAVACAPDREHGLDVGRLLGEVVSAVEAARDGSLVVRFAGGATIESSPGPGWSGWSVGVGAKHWLRAGPDGEVTRRP